VTVNRTVNQKVGDWKIAYDMLKPEITPPFFRQQLAMLQEQKACDYGCAIEHTHIQESGLKASLILARILMANDRQAALVAAIITGVGVKVVPLADDGPDE
jgi:hypothetical protein